MNPPPPRVTHLHARQDGKGAVDAQRARGTERLPEVEAVVGGVGLAEAGKLAYGWGGGGLVVP